MCCLRIVLQIKSDFDALLRENEKAPPEEQLSREQFQLDPDLLEMIEMENEEKINIGTPPLAIPVV